MTKDDLARAINGAFYGGLEASRGMPIAAAIDAYVRGLIAEEMREMPPLERLDMPREAYTGDIYRIATQLDWSPRVKAAIAEAVEAERAACSAARKTLGAKP